MAYVPIKRTRALIICTRPQDYAPARLREAARYLLDRRNATEERRPATEAIEGLRSKGHRTKVRKILDTTFQIRPAESKRANALVFPAILVAEPSSTSL